MDTPPKATRTVKRHNRQKYEPDPSAGDGKGPVRNVVVKSATTATSPIHFLTDQQRIFCDAIIAAKPPVIAARMAGYAQPESQCYSVLKAPKIQEAIKYLHKKHEKAADMTRKKVMDGMLEAIDFARIQADSGNMIAGWREIAKMCGYYAPEVKKIDITISAKRVIDQMETLSDADLIQMIEDESRTIEMEATEVLTQLQDASSQDAEEGGPDA